MTKSAPGLLDHAIHSFRLTVDNVDPAWAELKSNGADISIDPLTDHPGLPVAYARSLAGVMIEIAQR